MNISKLNRLIALLLNAIKKERKGSLVHDAIRWALKWLNKARVYLNNGNTTNARLCVVMAHDNIRFANNERHNSIVRA